MLLFAAFDPMKADSIHYDHSQKIASGLLMFSGAD